MRVYAIGDIHGYPSELERVHRLIAADRARTGDADAPVVHLGDLCDRGPDTRGVIDFILDGLARGENWITIMGNHDRLMALFLEDPPRHDIYMAISKDWFTPIVGGRETLASYGIGVQDSDRFFELANRFRAAVPEAHRKFIQSLPAYHETEDHIFVHAGIRPGIPLAEQTETDLVWIRRDFHDDPRDHGKLVVHGHTPVDAPRHYGNRLNLDTGAGKGKPASAAVLEGRAAWLLTENGRTPLIPEPVR